MKKLFILLIAISAVSWSCIHKPQTTEKERIFSPDGQISVDFWLEDGKPFYSAEFKAQPIIAKSALGMVFQENDVLSDKLLMEKSEKSTFDETWEQVWGQQKNVRNNYEELLVSLREEDGLKRQFQIVFRVFNDGLGFRYIVPEQENLREFVITDELTEFAMTDDHKAWWIPAYRDNRYEYLFTNSAISQMDTVHTPLTIETASGPVLSIHEAALVNYASMTLASNPGHVLKCDLTPWSDGTKVKSKTPMITPWRTVQIGENAGQLITSNLILNLNEPNKLLDLSFVKPNKYLGIWWGMHIGKYTFWESENHGANTELSKKYIDYCNKLGIDHLLIEGWNKGWTPEWYENKLHVFSFTECTSDFDFKEVTDYAKAHGVQIVGYHETGSNIDNYLSQIDAGMDMYENAEMESVKIGHVGSRLGMKEWHHGQYGVNYYQTVLDKAAEHGLAVNFHEPIKPTGLCRTYPHLMAGEGGRGQEYNAWSEGNPADHTTILPFTRLLAGPMDYTPGIFKIKGTRLHNTLANQLALYLTIWSPIQMLADLPENYDGHPAFQFLKDVPVNWDTTVVLNAQIGDYFTIARKDIASNDWYLGSITDENSRELVLILSFLDKDRRYKAQIYADGPDAAFDVNPESYSISELDVGSGDELKIHLAKGGGQAIRFVAL